MTAMLARLLSVNVGLPKDIDWRGKTVHTAIWKEPVQGRRTVRRLNIDGDGQGDLAGHGGEHRAVMVYQIDSYRYWERYFGRKFPAYGQLGENLTVDGLPDNEVCIGDRCPRMLRPAARGCRTRPPAGRPVWHGVRSEASKFAARQPSPKKLPCGRIATVTQSHASRAANITRRTEHYSSESFIASR
jgi:hypothetical protein